MPVSSGAISADAVFIADTISMELGLIFGLIFVIGVAFYMFGGAKF